MTDDSASAQAGLPGVRVPRLSFRRDLLFVHSCCAFRAAPPPVAPSLWHARSAMTGAAESSAVQVDRIKAEVARAFMLFHTKDSKNMVDERELHTILASLGKDHIAV